MGVGIIRIELVGGPLDGSLNQSMELPLNSRLEIPLHAAGQPMENLPGEALNSPTAPGRAASPTGRQRVAVYKLHRIAVRPETTQPDLSVRFEFAGVVDRDGPPRRGPFAWLHALCRPVLAGALHRTTGAPK